MTGAEAVEESDNEKVEAGGLPWLVTGKEEVVD